MKVTKVDIFLKNNSDIKAFANIVFDDCFIVRGFRIKEGKKGYYIQMPSRKNANGQLRNIVHPINRNTHLMIENTILDQYEIEINKDHTTDTTHLRYEE